MLIAEKFSNPFQLYLLSVPLFITTVIFHLNLHRITEVPMKVEAQIWRFIFPEN